MLWLTQEVYVVQVAKRMRPVGPKKTRKPGGKDMVSFRAPDDVMAYLNAAPDRTGLILKMIYVGKDCAETMGEEWWEVEKRANIAQQPIGKVLGRLALEAMAAEKKRK